MDVAAPENADRAARLLRLSGLLTRRIRSQSNSGLSITQEWAIALLIETPEGMSGAELARVQGVRAQTMSTALTGLQKAGYVRSVPDSADGRRQVLHATDEGIRAHDASREIKVRWLRDALAEFDRAELDEFDAGLALLERVAES
jgi:DNA-binding MarR family transcriptional regulator